MMNNSQDFDTETEIQRLKDDHAANLGWLINRITALEEKFGDPIKIAETLYDASQKAIKLEELIVEKLIRSINSNEKVKESLTELIDRTDRNYVKSTFKKWGGWVGALILAVVSGGIGYFLKGAGDG